MKNNKTKLNLFLVAAFVMVVIGAGTFKNISVRAQEENGFKTKASVLSTNNGEIAVLANSKNTTGGVVDGDLGDNDNTTGAAVGMVFADISDAESVFVGTKLTLSTNTTGAAIIFTVDGTSPSTENGNVYSEPIIINDDIVIKALASKDGELGEELELNYSVFKAESVTASVESGLVEFGTMIDLSTNTTGAAIYYTIEDLDFSDNTTSQAIKFENPIKVRSNIKIRAYSMKEGFKNSAIAEFSYKVDEEILIQKDFEEKVKVGEFASFVLKAKNNKPVDQAVCIVLAAYDENDRMLDYIMTSTLLTTNKAISTESGFRVPENSKYIRGFVVDEYNSLEPISNIIDIEVADE